MDIQKLKLIAEGNPGAFSVISQIVQNYNSDQANIIFNYLLQNNIKGTNLWLKYKDENQENIESMITSFNIIF